MSPSPVGFYVKQPVKDLVFSNALPKNQDNSDQNVLLHLKPRIDYVSSYNSRSAV